MSKLYVVGLGPGAGEGMTLLAQKALEEAQVLCGYKTYIELIQKDYPDKEVLRTPMTREVERCRLALEAAAAGKTVAMVCSGDAGVYGMSGLIYELAPEYPPVDIEVVPGVTAALAGGAILGAPLTHDFAVVSLSDLLTPWELIEKRLAAAAGADFVICLYNPSSKGRAGYLAKACDSMAAHRSPDTACGWVRSAGREGEQSGILTFAELREFEADMFTTVFIGNSNTRVIGGKLVTPRGYRDV